ncbi:hypothetical protein GCM10010441_78220 [Kitasatospora paracochleata]|uniref:Uncharacterized protein n=1 Tax=Kitasatospora paracochleata TaxID=58354 RepID=A0ABT1ITR3_9ACTN|nr:hypothetical protein [Kitasatospora paracochleata]MCP2308296.1 hypothetical protein [Kitasatospora paracochleata]
MDHDGRPRRPERGRDWLAEPPALAGAALLPLAGGGIGWRVQDVPGATAGALIGLVAAVALAVLVERG